MTEDLTAVFLAGGRSSRMGSPKALLPFAGRPLLEHLIARVGPVVSATLVVAAAGAALPTAGVRILHDEAPFEGPLAGLGVGLAAVETPLAFVSACDTPFLSPALILRLQEAASDADAVVPEWEGRPQPLQAVYRGGLAPQVKELLAAGERRPRALLDRVRTVYLREEAVRQVDPLGQSFVNMNTPEEYRAALERWGQEGREQAEARENAVSIELLGVARLLARTDQVSVTVGPDALAGQVLAELARRFPALLSCVIDRNGELQRGHALCRNGLELLRDPLAPVRPGEHLLLLSTSAGG
jgi:molybdopterin-guanine dinucleotide biosynthesis protein A